MSGAHYDQLETRDPEARELALFNMLPGLVARCKELAPGWAHQLRDVEPTQVSSREALAALPVLRKAALPVFQATMPPLGGLATVPTGALGRVFMSPGPIFEPEGRGEDWWRSARALYAAGVRSGEVVHNTFSYHLTPGGWIMDAGARSLGCAVIPAGPGNVEQQLEIIQHLKPTVYVGVPEFLKMLLDKGRDAGRDIGSFRRALVSGGVLPPTLRHEFRTRGIATFQLYATADAGIIAYESEPQDAMIVDEGVIVEIVRPGTGETLLPGEIGEVVVTSFNRDYPMLRLATGDLSAVVPGVSACGRTNTRIRGWLGRADQSTRVRGTVVTPEQIAEIGKRHPDLNRLRLVITRAGNDDHVVLKAEGSTEDPALAALLTDTFAAITKTRGDVQIVAPGSLPRDGRVISDERPGA